MATHRIRLVGPWESQTVDDQSQPVGEVVRCQLPFAVPEACHATGILLMRGFHRPTGIDGSTTLSIVLKGREKPQEVRLNGAVISESTTAIDNEFAYDVTSLVESFNRLSVLFAQHSAVTQTALETAWLQILD